MRTDIRRGDMFVYTPHGVDSVQRFTRPAVIVSNDIGNRFSPNVILCTLFGEKGKDFPLHVHVGPDEMNYLVKDSVVQCEMIFTVSKNELGRYIGHLSDEAMALIDESLGISVGVLV